MEKKETNRDMDFATDEVLKSGCNRGDCPYRQQVDARPSPAEIIAGMIGVLFLTVLLFFSAHAANHWLAVKSQQLSERLLWREPVERW
jgi:hypothetical protein